MEDLGVPPLKETPIYQCFPAASFPPGLRIVYGDLPLWHPQSWKNLEDSNEAKRKWPAKALWLAQLSLQKFPMKEGLRRCELTIEWVISLQALESKLVKHHQNQHDFHQLSGFFTTQLASNHQREHNFHLTTWNLLKPNMTNELMSQDSATKIHMLPSSTDNFWPSFEKGRIPYFNTHLFTHIIFNIFIMYCKFMFQPCINYAIVYIYIDNHWQLFCKQTCLLLFCRGMPHFTQVLPPPFGRSIWGPAPWAIGAHKFGVPSVAVGFWSGLGFRGAQASRFVCFLWFETSLFFWIEYSFYYLVWGEEKE